jgi:hypothetical protein
MDKRKLLKLSKVHITPAKREANKIEDGIPTRPLSRSERRYWAKVNRYCRKHPDADRLEMLKPLCS